MDRLDVASKHWELEYSRFSSVLTNLDDSFESLVQSTAFLSTGLSCGIKRKLGTESQIFDNLVVFKT